MTTDTAHPWRKSGDRIDSILPMPEYLRRFRDGVGEPAGFTNSESSRDALGRRVLKAVAARDTAALTGLVVSRAEFAWLVFPHHPYARPPYELDPGIYWMQLAAGTEGALGRILNELGGRRLNLLSFKCRPDVHRDESEPVRFWSGCELRCREGEGAETRRFFASVVEREGRVKLLSLASGF